MATYANLQKDLQGFQTRALDFSDLIYNASMLDGSHSEVTVPSVFTNWYVRIQPDYYGTWWVSVNDTAAVPAGATFAASTSELINVYEGYELKVKAGDSISIYNNSGSTGYISIALYAVKNGAN